MQARRRDQSQEETKYANQEEEYRNPQSLSPTKRGQELEELSELQQFQGRKIGQKQKGKDIIHDQPSSKSGLNLPEIFERCKKHFLEKTEFCVHQKQLMQAELEKLMAQVGFLIAKKESRKRLGLSSIQDSLDQLEKISRVLQQ